jgi:hypothetical protein
VPFINLKVINNFSDSTIRRFDCPRMFNSKTAAALCLAAIALIPVSAQLYAATSSAPAESAAWSKFVNDYVEATFKAQPFFAVYAGRHEFDGQMPDLSRAGIDEEITRLQAARRAALTIDAAGMSNEQKFERDYLVTVIDNSLFWYSKAKFPFRKPRLVRKSAGPGHLSLARICPASPADARLHRICEGNSGHSRRRAQKSAYAHAKGLRRICD